MSPLVAVCGLAAEAKILAGTGIPVIAGGGDGVRLAADLRALPSATRALLSFGAGGGLDPALAPGDLQVASSVVADAGSLDADRRWAQRLAERLGVAPSPFAGADLVVATTKDKAGLRARTGAALVDMETHIVAAEAARRGIPWAAVRAVTDPAHRALPHAAAVGMRPDGSVDLVAILSSLARRPGQLPGLVRTGLDARAAFAALLRSRQVLGPGFALLDLGEPLLHVT